MGGSGFIFLLENTVIYSLIFIYYFNAKAQYAHMSATKYEPLPEILFFLVQKHNV